MARFGFFLLKPASVTIKHAPYAGTLPARRSTKTSSFLIKWVLSCLIAVGIVILQRQENPHILKLQQTITTLSSPLVSWTAHPFRMIASWGNFFISHQTLLDENASLKRQNEYLLRTHHQIQHHAIENTQLKQALNIAKTLDPFHTVAKVTGQTYNGVSSSLIIQTEAHDRIEKNSPVLSTEGFLLGRVISDESETARVMLLTNVNSRVPVQLEHTREHAILSGDNGINLKLIHLEKTTKVTVGTRLVTSGFGGVFPKGIPVAEVISVEGETIKARPYAFSNKTDYVLLLTCAD